MVGWKSLDKIVLPYPKIFKTLYTCKIVIIEIFIR